MRRAYFDGPFGQAHARLAGEGPTLLLLHQSPLSSDQFTPALPLLAAAGLQVVAIDTPGYGLSDASEDAPSVEGYAETAAAVLDALGTDRAAVLGHHTGAAVATALAARHGDRVSRVILNGVPLLSAEERAHFATFDFSPPAPRADGGHLTDAWAARLKATPGWTDLAAMHRHLVTALGAGAHYGDGFQAAFAYDLAADLAKIEAPGLIFTNTGDDLYAASKRAHELRPDFAYAELEGGTHDIVDEAAEAWSRVVADFTLTGEAG